MKLDVPLVTQPEDSVECGLAGVAMILQYYGDEASDEELRKALPTDAAGTYTPQLGTYLLGRGYDVTLVTAHPRLFAREDLGMSEDRVRMRLRTHKGPARDAKVVRFFEEFLDAGGRVDIRIPDERVLKEELAAGRPVGAPLTTHFLYGPYHGMNSHFNVITGMDHDYVYANDPNWIKGGGENRYDKQEFFYCFYTNTPFDLDNGSFILVRKK